MAGVADQDLPAGMTFKVYGHHHQIDGLVPELLNRNEYPEVAPFYLLNGQTLKKDVKKGNPVTTEDVDLEAIPIYSVYKKGLELK